MPTIKIADPPPPPCRHPDHNPPSHRVFKPGTYQHTCPKCGASSTFTITKPFLLEPLRWDRRNKYQPCPERWPRRIYGPYPT